MGGDVPPAVPGARCAARSRSAPHASARVYPSAAASSVLHRPSGASMPAMRSMVLSMGSSATFTPHTTAAGTLAPGPAARTARCASHAATSEEEQAVSTLALGPASPKR
eukprot:4432678-Pyramimonas_sp.AAC.1